MPHEETKRQRLESIYAQLDLDYSTFMNHHRDLTDYVKPVRGRFTITESNKGTRKNNKIVDNTGTIALRNATAGMMGGLTSPSRPWKKLTTPDPELSEFGPVKEWLDVVDRRMDIVFNRSNLYQVLPNVYSDLLLFGTAPMMIEEDFTKVIRCTSVPVGSYRISNNDDLVVDTFGREFRLTVRQLVEKFGKRFKGDKEIDWSKFSDGIKTAYDSGHMEHWREVRHVIRPNEEWDITKEESKYKRYKSVWYEKSNRDEEDRFLRESGFDMFPVLVPRWQTTGEDVYGTDCPGMTALGDIRALMVMRRRVAQALEKKVNPPMVGPASLKNGSPSILAGDFTYLDERDGLRSFRPAHEVNFQISEVKDDIREHQLRISRAFFEDLFLMIASTDRRQITAREIDERHEEKLLALGPVLEQLNQDLLDPLVDITFDMMTRQGLIPEPPEELQGVTLKVEYISIMAQAQKLVGIGGIERFTGYVTNLAASTGNTSVFDNVNFDELVTEYGETIGVSPKIMNTREEVEAIRTAQAEAQAIQAQQQQIVQAASTAKELSQSDLEGDNALKRLVEQET